MAYKVDDFVIILGKIISVDDDASSPYEVQFSDDDSITVVEKDILGRAAAPVRAGDKVISTKEAAISGELLALTDKLGWVQPLDGSEPITAPLADLRILA